METSQLICCANQLTGFYVKATLAFNRLEYKSVLDLGQLPTNEIEIFLIKFIAAKGSIIYDGRRSG